MILEKVNKFNGSEVSTKFLKYGVKNRKHFNFIDKSHGFIANVIKKMKPWQTLTSNVWNARVFTSN